MLNGRVAIAGRVIDDPDEPVETDGLVLTVEGRDWPWHEKALILLHKPAGYECSQKPKHWPSVMTLLPPPLRWRSGGDLQPVGRLDHVDVEPAGSGRGHQLQSDESAADVPALVEEVKRLRSEVDQLRGDIATLMQAAVQAGGEAMAESSDQLVLSGERNLLTVEDFSHDLGSLRRMFDLFEQKTQLMRLLDVSSRADGVRIFIGGESRTVPYEELSVDVDEQFQGVVIEKLGKLKAMLRAGEIDTDTYEKLLLEI